MQSLTRVYVGIDPGLSGGIAAIYDNGYSVGGGTHVNVWQMPENLEGLADILEFVSYNKVLKRQRNVQAVIEKVGVMPNQGISSAFTFGQGYGALKMGLVANAIPFEEVPPQKWQKEFTISSRKKQKGKLEFKKHLRDIARQLYPKLSVWNETQTKQLAIADALLIATYARKVFK